MNEEDEEFERIKRRIELETLPLINFTKQKEWVGLTDDEVNDLYNEGMGIHATIEATEAKLRSKNT